MTTPDAFATPRWNRLQRCYFRWAESHYLRLPEALQPQARAMDQFLYSRRGLWVWLGGLALVAAATTGIWRAGLPLGLALLVSLLLTFGLVIALVAAWLQPDKLVGKGSIGRLVLKIMGGAVVGVLLGWVVGRLGRRGGMGADSLGGELERLLHIGLPIGVGMGLLLALLISLTASSRRYQLQQQLASTRAAEERERMAREASEARLRLLQAQIQPHFIFNTLSAVQHWVDSGDARASGLLRALTSFLRGSAEQMLRPRVSLAEELALVDDYLRVMQARWGERLRYQLDIAPDAGRAAELPPGIVLSLVENALEHGLAPRLNGGRLSLSLSAAPGGGWCLRIEDDGVGLAPDWREGLGLANSRARLEHAFGRRARLELRAAAGGGTVAELSVQEQPQSQEAA